MSTINTGYANSYSTPTSVSSSPANFGPGQLKTNEEQADNSQSKAREASESERTAAANNNSGYTTATRGSQLNITV